MILTPSIFQGDISIGQQASEYVQPNIEWFISKYEPKYCHAVIGEKLYKSLPPSPSKGGGVGDDVEDRWIELKEKLAYPCACFVYFHYMMDSRTTAMGGGEFGVMAENSERVSPWAKMVRAWNEMVDETPGIMKWIDQSGEYPDYLPDMKLYIKLGLSRYENMLGI